MQPFVLSTNGEVSRRRVESSWKLKKTAEILYLTERMKIFSVERKTICWMVVMLMMPQGRQQEDEESVGASCLFVRGK